MLKRSIFLLMVLGVVLPGQQDLDKKLWERARTIHERVTVIDNHCHDLFKEPPEGWPRQCSLELMNRGGMDGVGYSLGGLEIPEPAKTFTSEIDDLKQQFGKADSPFKTALQAGDFAGILKKGKKAIWFSIEYFFGALEGKIDTLDAYHKAGVRAITLIQGGKDVLYENETLTPFGKQAIARMNELGILVDITHLPEAIQYQAIKVSRGPVIASHSNIRAVTEDTRNLPDKMIKMMAKKGGMMMVTFYPEYVNKDCFKGIKGKPGPQDIPKAEITNLIDHLGHVVHLVGAEYVGIGSDYGGSGRITPRGLETAAGYPQITYHLLKRGYTEAQVAGIMGGNVIRVLKRAESIARR